MERALGGALFAEPTSMPMSTTRKPAFTSPRTVVITGASAGVGRATALEFARRGWRVGLLARGEEGLRAAQADVEQHGGTALALRADVADPLAVKRAAAEVVAAWGAIDVWINNAMATVYARLGDMTPEEFRRVTEVTFLGQVYGTQAALAHMRRRRRGTIVCIGSSLAYRGIPLQSAYCAAKFAVRGFVESVRSELIHDGSDIRITMVQLPAVNTPQFDWARNRMPQRPQPVPPIVQPEAVATAIFRAACEGPRELWVGAATARVIAGNMLVPELADELAAHQAYAGQQSDRPARGDEPDNLFEPLDERQSFGARGRFDAQAATRVVALDPARLRLGLGAAVLGLGAVLLWRGKARRRRADLRRPDRQQRLLGRRAS